MITVSKEFQWAMAHMLDGHMGLCKNLHGHEYKLVVTVAAKKIDQTPGIYDSGMVVDFKHLKEIVNELIVEPLDHALMLNGSTTDNFEKELQTLAIRHQKKHFVVNCRPTAENMVEAFAQLLKNNFEDTNLVLVGLRLFETPTSYADWQEGEL